MMKHRLIFLALIFSLGVCHPNSNGACHQCLRPLAAEERESHAFPNKNVIRALGEGLKKIKEMIDAEVERIPLDGQLNNLSDEIYKAYASLFAEICDFFPTLKPLVKIRLQAGDVHPDAIEPLKKAFEANDYLFVFGDDSMRYKGRKVERLPLLVVYRILSIEDIQLPIIGNVVMPVKAICYSRPSLVALVESMPISGFAVTGYKIEESLSVAISPESLSKELAKAVTARLCIKENRPLPETLLTRDPVTKRNLIEVYEALLKRQWPEAGEFGIYNTKKIIQMWFGLYLRNYLTDSQRHELVHMLLPGKGEEFTYLFDIACGRFPWLVLSDIVTKEALAEGIEREGASLTHEEQRNVILYELIPDILKRHPPGFFPGITAAEYTAALRKTAGINWSLIKIIPKLPEADLQNEAFSWIKYLLEDEEEAIRKELESEIDEDAHEYLSKILEIIIRLKMGIPPNIPPPLIERLDQESEEEVLTQI